MELHQAFHNFIVTAVKQVEELQGTLYEMEYQPTGTKLAWLERKEENKTFGIAFRTLPEDDTGVFHILEHSVLCGSRRYPVREPFVELMKSSMQTFLNAMTFPDKTVYPVASRNPTDFLNLIRVYMDAVLHPAIYEKPEIFRQEGWHYELRDSQTQPIYKGVVFNEMKGVMSSPEELMRWELNRRMFPDTCYRFVSGGDPEHIPELTYEQFLDCHHRFYYPSNAFLFLDGQVDIAAVLALLDEEYLREYTREPHCSAPAYQLPADGGESRIHYELSPAEPLKGKVRVAWGFGLGDVTHREEQIAAAALAELLCGSNHSLLKQAVLSAGLAEDISLGILDGIRQPYVSLLVRNLEEGQINALNTLIRRTLESAAASGLDHSHLKAILANLELRLRERDYGYMPQGVGLGIELTNSWLYGIDPAEALSSAPVFQALNQKVDTGWYEELLEKIFLWYSFGQTKNRRSENCGDFYIWWPWRDSNP